jgi:hypothetical protein
MKHTVIPLFWLWLCLLPFLMFSMQACSLSTFEAAAQGMRVGNECQDYLSPGCSYAKSENKKFIENRRLSEEFEAQRKQRQEDFEREIVYAQLMAKVTASKLYKGCMNLMNDSWKCKNKVTDVYFDCIIKEKNNTDYCLARLNDEDAQRWLNN